MRINTNTAALNSYNQLKNTNNNLSKSLSRLSSGKRINGAADDAAGLAISEKMGSQTRGLAQAQRNAQDGISMIQTAEGALKESHSILQRMRELSVQSANDTNTSADRAEIQKEVDQLASELTRIGETTEFNTQKLLDGSLDSTKFQIGANEGQNMDIAINDMQANALGVASEGGAEFEIDATQVDIDTAGVTLDDTAFSEYGSGQEFNVEELSETRLVENSQSDGYIQANYAVTNSDGNIVAVSEDGSDYSVIDMAATEQDLENTQVVDNGSGADLNISFADPVTSGNMTIDIAEVTSGDIGTIDATATATIEDTELETGSYTVSESPNDAENIDDITNYDIDGALTTDAEVLLDENNNAVAISKEGSTDWYAMEDFDEANAIVSADVDAALSTNTALADGAEVEITGDGGIDVSTQDAANSAISTLDDAIANVSAERSKLGAVQNRLDHTINNLNTAEENLTAAESRISDVDMAKEMMNMSKQQILSQAGTAMMAQANQLPQGVLQLLG